MTPLSPAQLYALALACRPEGVSTLLARKATLSRLARLGLCARPHRHRSRYRVGRLERAYRTVATAEGRGVVLLLGTLAAGVPLQMAIEYGEACSEYTHLCERGGPPRIVDQARAARDRALEALRMAASEDPVGDTVRGEPKTSRGKSIVEAAREMADAAERAAVSYEHGSALGRAQGDSDAAGARSEIERLVADFEGALSAAEERARRAEADADRAINALRTALRALLEQAERPTIPGLEEAKAEARRVLAAHEEVPF